MQLHVGNVVEWLERCDCDRHDLGSKRICAILLCSWEKHFTALFSAWRSLASCSKFQHISIKLKYRKKSVKLDSNILASPEAGRGDYLPYV